MTIANFDKFPNVLHRTRAEVATENREATAVLYLTNELPVPPRSGGALREYELLKRVARRFTVHFVAFTPTFDSERDNIQAALSIVDSVTLVKTDTPAPGQSVTVPLRILRYRAARGLDVVERLIGLFEPDLIHVQGYFLTQHVPKTCEIPFVLAEDNVEFQLDQDCYRVSGRPQGELVEVAKREELRAWRSAQVCVAITPEDAAIIRSETEGVPVRYISVGFDHLKHIGADSSVTAAAKPVVLYVANYSWEPSADGACYLLRDVWPEILKIIPDARLLLAGPQMGAGLLELGRATENVDIYGSYQYFGEVAQTAMVFVCPLRYGGGIKIKMIEALQYGLPVVATPGALSGLPESLRELVFVGESSVNLALLATSLLESSRTNEVLRRRAHKAIQCLPTWDQAAFELSDAWMEAVR